MKGRLLITMCLIIIVIQYSALCQSNDELNGEGKRWNITFSTESIETILLDPESILENPDLFWETDGAYILSSMWHKNYKVSLDDKNYYENWKSYLAELAAIPKEERNNNEGFKLVEAIKKRIPLFYEKGLPAIDAFLPENSLKFSTTVFITNKTYSFAFMTNTRIVMDPLSYYFNKDPDRIFNTLAHECFHIGYGINRYLREETELENGYIYNTMLDALQNEGMATYFGYTLQNIFPAPDIPDYILLENPADVKRLFADVNRLFSTAENLTADSLQKASWKTGVVNRGYYIVGAFMSKTIEDKLGHEALVKTIAIGPLNFVDTYNRLVEDEMKVYAFKKPTGKTLLQQLKSAVFDENKTEFIRVADDITRLKEELPSNAQSNIERIGYGMMYKERYEWAVSIFTLNADLFHESANAWDCLAEAYLTAGDIDSATKYYRHALAVDPTFSNAILMLEKIEKMK
ncbi:MAG: tetratricopeptide repeat protein [Bacteroidales bacterium]|nr:tetratricopeptide repeat protein [Bacteroidales bacterium]